jgi:hypothetical protein
MNDQIERVARALCKSLTDMDPDEIGIDGVEAWRMYEIDAVAAISALADELRNHERYMWLRNKASHGSITALACAQFIEFDAAIDAARREEV